MKIRSRSELLARADQFVARGEVLCARQAARVAQWRAEGWNTAEAEAVLAKLEQTLTEMRLYRVRLEADEQDPTP